MSNYPKQCYRLFCTLSFILIILTSAGKTPAADEVVNFTIFFSGNVLGELDVCG
jgi:hypothetical protein